MVPNQTTKFVPKSIAEPNLRLLGAAMKTKGKKKAHFDFQYFFLVVVLFLIFVNAGAIQAQENPDIKMLLDKITALEMKVSQLEGRLAMKEHVTPEKAVVPYTPPTGDGFLKAVEDIHVGGYVSTAYNLNTLSPNPDGNSGAAPTAGAANAAGNNTNIRTFDRDSNTFLHNVQVEFEKLANDLGSVGFRSDLMFGRDAQILNAAVIGDATDNLFVEQAYIHYVVPVGKGIDIKAGRFVTITGAEVIESKDNWNSSRSLLFNNAIPFTHNGVLGSYQFNDLVDVKLGVANGWDSAIDNNKGKTLLSGISLHPLDGVDFTQNFLYGSEQARTVGGGLGNQPDRRMRGLLDSVLAWTPIASNERWKILANFDYGWEEKGTSIDGNSIWQGTALGTKYDVNDWLTLAARWEYFADTDGHRIGSLNGLTTAERNHLYEMTYTADIKLARSLLTRLEWRYDWSTDPIFDLSNNAGVGARDAQSTIGAEVIYAF